MRLVLCPECDAWADDKFEHCGWCEAWLGPFEDDDQEDQE